MGIIIDRCPCGALIATLQRLRDRGRGYYCDKTCFYTYRNPRVTGLTYTVKRPNPGQYQPGNNPWNKRGTTGG